MDRFLLESGDFLLIESGDNLLLEGAIAIPPQADPSRTVTVSADPRTITVTRDPRVVVVVSKSGA